MAAPIADKVLLPLDTGNTGKKVRTQTRVVGADTVHEHFFVPVSKDTKTGFYKAHSGILTIPTAAHNGTTTGHLWFQNPVANTTRAARIRRLKETVQMLSGAIDLTVPRQLFSRFTFTGTASGAALTAARRDSTDAAPTCDIRTAVTGMTTALVASIRHAGIPQVNATLASATIQVNLMPVVSWQDYDEEEGIVVRPGEGVVLWSADASTTANRRLFSDWEWEEFDIS